MKLRITLLSFFISITLWVSPQAQEKPLESILGTWTNIDYPSQPSDLFLCNTYRLILQDEQSGYLSISITSKVEENNWMTYHGKAKFSYTSSKEEEMKSISIAITYEPFEFEFEHRTIRTEKEAIPQNLRYYISEMEQHLSGSKKEYELIQHNKNNLEVKGFSVIQNTTYANFQRRNRGERCR